MLAVENENGIILNKIKNLAEAFITTARKKFKVELDYSEESLVIADDLITLFFKTHKDHFYKSAVIIGCYLGEVIIKNLGGKWLSDHSIKKVGKAKILIKPILKAKKRLANGLAESLVTYYRTLKINACFCVDFAMNAKKIEECRKILVEDNWDKELLKRTLNHAEPKYVREEAADLLSRIHSNKIINELIKSLALGNDYTYYSAIALQGFNVKKNYKPLMASLAKTKNNAVKMQILLALGNLRNTSCIDDIIDYLNDEDELLSYYASIAIGKIGGDKALKYLMNILGGLREGRRLYAISALEIMQDKRAVPALIEALFSRDEQIREAAARALQFMPDVRAYKPLLYLLKESSINLKIFAAYALANIDKHKALETIRDLLKDEVELVRRHADNILKHIESGNQLMLKCV